MYRRIIILAVVFVIAMVMAIPAFACGDCGCGCPPPPPPPECGCSPGFWKQEHHFQYWVGHNPTDPYPDDPSMTLLDALQGGKATRESRFVVAGWLNTANPDAPCD